MNLGKHIHTITPDFLKHYNFDYKIFAEVYFQIIKEIKFENYKVSTSLTEERFKEIVHTIPSSYSITEQLIISLTLDFDSVEKEEFRKLISLYIFFNCVIKSKKTFVNPFYSLIFDRLKRLRRTGPATLWVSKYSKKIGEALDNETWIITKELDLILNANHDVLDIEVNRKTGRPQNKLEDVFITTLNEMIKKKHDKNLNLLVEIVRELQSINNFSFSELPVSKEAIIKILQKQEKPFCWA